MPETLESLKTKHPPAPPGHIDWTPPDQANVATITKAAFAKILCRCENGVGGGPSGMTFEHLRDATIANAAVTTHLHALVNTILQGPLPEEVCSLLTASRLIALAKPEGGTRPIAVGECILRLAAKSALSALAEEARGHFLPLQYCVAIQGGSEASQLHEQQQEELVGREGIAAPREVAEEQETAGGEVAAAAAAVENGATATEPEAAVAVEAADTAGPEVVAAEATGAAVAVERGGPDAAFVGGSTSPSAITQALQPEVLGPAVALEQTEEAELAVSPEPVTATVLEAVVIAAAGEQDGDQAEEDEPTTVVSTETSAAAEGASTQGHGQEGSDRRGHGPGVAACAARGKAGKKKLRAQPAPRRPGAGLGPGPPGPLLGWLLQGQLPRTQGRQLPSAGTSGGGIEAKNGIRQATTVNNNTPAAAAVDTAAQQTPRRETRSTTRAQGITWGQPRGHQTVPANTPWIPAGRAPQAGRGGRNAENSGRGGATACTGRGGARGARGGRRGGGAIIGGREALLRSGTWRERHDRPEQVADPTTQNEADAERGEDGEDYEASASMPSEEMSLEEEGEGTTRGERRRQEERRNPREERVNEEAPNEGQSDPGARSPSDLADDSSIWELAATWDKYPLQKGDQPFVVRRMLPKILESYTLCLLAPLIRL
ncbi:unnamed protein product [Closterium sp. Naga37s-1]|nr:unnamed protein product [Closterium sp. Naga37s-1]